MRICVSVRGMLAEPRNGRQRSQWGPRPEPGDRRRQCGGRAPPRALRGTRSDGPREARLAAGWRPAMPDRPGTREAGAVTDSVSAPVHGHGHRVGCGMDQPAYAFLRFASYESCYPSPLGDPRGRHLTDFVRDRFQDSVGQCGPDGRTRISPASRTRRPEDARRLDPCHISGAHDPRPRTNRGL